MVLNRMGHFVQYSYNKSTSFYPATAGQGETVSLVFDRQGKRKYLTPKERRQFLNAAAKSASPEVGTFCCLLTHTGVRISEALAIRPSQIDKELGVIVVRSLKKRRSNVYRAVPVPPSLVTQLQIVHDIGRVRDGAQISDEPIWAWCRTTAWQRVKVVMRAADIHGPQATPKGLRHGFAVAALDAGVPLNIVQKWLGHARLHTTAIYADAVGEEERSIAQRMWQDL